MGNSLKGIVVFVLFLFISFCLSAQRIDTAWTRTFGGSGWENGQSVQQTTDGGYIVAGWTDSYGAGEYDVYLIKTDSLGDALWMRTYGGGNYDWGYSTQQTDDGGYIISGHTWSYGAGSTDVYLIKTDSLGDTLWTRTYGGISYEAGCSVQQTTDKGYIVAGGTQSYGAGEYDVYLIKTDSLGDTLWTKTFGGGSYDLVYSVQQTTDKGYIVAGGTWSYGAGSSDVYLIKTDSLGDTLWTKTFGGSEFDGGHSVQQTTDGGYIVAGWTWSWGSETDDVYLIKTDSLGDTLWTRTYGGSDYDQSYSVQQTTDGGYIVAGGTASYGAGAEDVYLIKTDSLGDTLWTKTVGGSQSEEGQSVQQTNDGGYMVVGQTASYGVGNIYLIKIKPSRWITVTFPNGGEEWQANSTHDITWRSYETSGGIKIEYSLNNGLDWTEIIASMPDTGAYPWTIPDTLSYSCLVRVSDTNGTLSDISNKVFTIFPFPFIIVTSPNGGETWTVDSTYNITWSSVDIGSSVSIECSINNGSDWMSIEDTIPDTETYPWIIPFAPSDSCLVKIASLDGSISDTSDSVFTIFSPPFITVTSPNGGEEWQADSTYDITWTSYKTSGGVKIEYSLNNGIDWTEIIASIPDTGAYPWTIPDTLSFSCLVRVSDTNGLLEDISNSVFRISPPFIIVTSPNGGEEWQGGTNHDIIWASAGTSGKVKIEYSINNGRDWAEIIASTPDNGNYLWNPPYITSDSCLVSISDTNGSLSDMSDSVFSIIPAGVPIGSLEVYSLNVRAIATGSQVEFTYTLPEKANDIKFTLYNVAGLKIKEENLKESSAGFYSGKINMNGISKGIYFIKMEANGGKFTQTKRFVLM
jgi:hypothetical protein